MKPAAFTYHRARTVAGAVGLLAELGEEAELIAGGQSLVAMMNFRLARPEHLVDIGAVPGLDHIRLDGSGLRIGALVTHHAVETADLDPGFAVVRDTMRWIGHLPIRTRGTVGGSLAHADATAEWCLLAVLLDAGIVAEGPGGRRTIPAAGMFHGPFTTALDADEMIVEVAFPRPAPHAAVTEFAERRGDFAIVAAGVDIALSADGSRVHGGRVVLGGVAPVPLRVPAAEAVLARGDLAGPDLFAECAATAAAAIDPRGDATGSAHYRRALTRTLVARACEEALSR
ncbi:FAD binding domain-containing protein [Pseudonocardia acidicola]|uniref:Xanthine dehydrogenase family protein subunit M n=1 Tax=Pseudonocardia acidicola TaxID=2724939 RepID=A0ABX1SC28_9PSEU|nr:FAD binding domain-containing protein [Pseudonocardia acidicola]NMH97906.1 xanthine dehydrogenase family protein subunit M [Pseudonocardia acidicola]